jgi:hypothetical protein
MQQVLASAHPNCTTVLTSDTIVSVSAWQSFLKAAILSDIPQYTEQFSIVKRT